MKHCVFCDMPSMKDREVARNTFAKAFLTNIPIVPGHTLVIPIRCVARYEELHNAEKEAIENVRNIIMKSLKKTFKAEGFNFSWNDGKVAGQSVPHFHLHIIPRKLGDTGITQYEPREFLYRPSNNRPEKPEEELKEVAHIIKNAIA